MGGCASTEANGPELQRSKEIDRMLKEVSLVLRLMIQGVVADE